MKTKEFKIYILVTVILFLILNGIYYHQTRLYALNQAEKRVEDILVTYKAIREYISKQQKSEIFSLQKNGIIDKEFFMPQLLSSTYGARTINGYYNILRKDMDKYPITIKFASTNPRNPLNKATKYEEKILKLFNDGKIDKFNKVVNTPEGKILYYATATQRNAQRCMRCHSDPKLAPTGLINRYGNKNGFYEEIGTMRAMMWTTMPLDEYYEDANRLFIYLSLITSIVLGLILLIARKFISGLQKEANKLKAVLNSEENIVVISDGIHILDCNKRFLDFFGYKNIDNFAKEHDCICDFFEKEKNIDYLQKDMNGIVWSDYLLNNRNKEIIKVKMSDISGKKHIFQVNAQIYLHENKALEYVITFNNITQLEYINNNLEKLVNEKTKGLSAMNRELEESEHELQLLNENLKIEIDKEVIKNREKDNILFEQTKMAALGEMIGNIAHQWRQPLSVISTSATGIQLQKEYGILDDEYLNNGCEAINKNAQYLSKTIDDFRNFIRGDSKKEIFNLKESAESFLTLVATSIKKYNINIKLVLDKDININGLQNELNQCFLNIFNNSKDVLKNKDGKRYIYISGYKEDDKVIIVFKDNGGGINENIIDKIFEPYFTTKHQSQGTGLGLHMTYRLIVNGMGGTIEADNVTYSYNGKEYTGAEFTISLPME